MAISNAGVRRLIHHVTRGNMPKSHEELLSLPSHEQVMFIQFAQQMESLGILVADKLINIDLVDKTLGEFVVSGGKSGSDG